MISYAQNHEDVVLARALAGVDSGLYVDVGAEDPVVNSVTKHFYDMGWRGVNVEPSARCVAALQEMRPGDVNVAVGVADYEGKATFFEGPQENHGSSTFRPDIAEGYRRRGEQFVTVQDVPLTTLAVICDEYVGDRTIDFMKIDVEGYEAEVIAGGNWERWRPRVMVVEATVPNTRIPAYQQWEPALLAAGYHFALFDGLNRFYVRAEDLDLLEPLSSPACVLDSYVDFTTARRTGELEAAVKTGAAQLAEVSARASEIAAVREEAARLGAEAAEFRQRLGGVPAELDRWQERGRAAEAGLREAERSRRLSEDHLAQARDEALRVEVASAALRERLAEETAARRLAEETSAAERAARVEAGRELAAVFATRTFRWTALPRRLYGLTRRTPG